MEKPTRRGNALPITNKLVIPYLIWTFVWIASLVLVDKNILYQFYPSEILTIIGIGINVVLGVVMIFAFIRYLKAMDELQQKIQLDALAFALGLSLVGTVCYSLLVTAGYVTDEEVTDIIMIMVFSHMLGLLLGNLRYR